MSDNINPYEAPNPAEEKRHTATHGKKNRPRKLIGPALWWTYFAILCWFFVLNARSLQSWVHYHYIATASPFHIFEILIQALGLICLVCYLKRIPLLHSFFWGLVFFSQSGVTLFRIYSWAHFYFRFDDHYWNWQIAMLYASIFAPIPQCYVLWRYSSSSSPIWQLARIPWRQLGQRLVETIRHLRRA